MVDPGERFEVGDRHALVDLMDGRADQTEFDHRADALEESGVGRAAGGGQFRDDAELALDQRLQQIGEGTGRGEESLGAALGLEAIVAAVGIEPGAQRRLEGARRVAIVEADVEGRSAPPPGSDCSRGCPRPPR